MAGNKDYSTGGRTPKRFAHCQSWGVVGPPLVVAVRARHGVPVHIRRSETGATMCRPVGEPCGFPREGRALPYPDPSHLPTHSLRSGQALKVGAIRLSGCWAPGIRPLRFLLLRQAFVSLPIGSHIGIEFVSGAVFPQRALAIAGLLQGHAEIVMRQVVGGVQT